MKPAEITQFRCPLIFTVTGLTALAMLGYSGDELPFAVVAALLFVAPYLTKWRLPESITAVWIVRLVLYLFVVSVTRASVEGSSDLTGPHGVIVLGCVSGAEMALQCWRRRPAGNPPGVSLILFAGLTYLTACYTSDTTLVPKLTPAYFLLMILSWRRLEAQTLRDPLSAWARVSYVATILIAIGMGFLIWLPVSGYTSDLDSYAARYLDGAPPPPRTGMEGQPQLGSTFGQQGSAERELLLSADPNDPHLRTMAYETYSLGTWSPPLDSRMLVSGADRFGTKSTNRAEIKVTKLHYDNGLVYYPLDTDYLKLDNQVRSRYCPTDAGPIEALEPSPSTYCFSEATKDGDYLDTPDQGFSANDLNVPTEITPAVKVIARQLVARIKSSKQKIQAICAYLDANHRYSLTYSGGSGDPVSGFILSKKAAHCEYFASAAVILLRIAGIPARYVIGYYAHEHTDSGEVVVRERDAHAWAEAFVNGSWTTVDATPAGGRPDELFGPVPMWQTAVENFEDKLQFLRDWASRTGPANIVAIAIGVIAAYFLVRIGVKEWLSRSRKPVIRYQDSTAMAPFRKRFQRLLDRHKIVVPDGQTWSERFAQVNEFPLDRHRLVALLDCYNAVKFGGENAEQLDQMLSELENEIPTKEHV